MKIPRSILLLLLISPLQAFSQEDSSYNKNDSIFQDTLMGADSMFQVTDSIEIVPNSSVNTYSLQHFDTLSQADSAKKVTNLIPKRKILSEALIPEEEEIDTVIVIPLELTTSCYNFKSRLEWGFNGSDSLLPPQRLYLHLQAFLQSEFTGDTLKLVDSISFKNRSAWVSHPGVYFLSFFDTASGSLYKSTEVSVHICTAYELPDKFKLGTDKVLKPKQNYNIEKIDLIIFSTHGEEVFTTTNPAIEWDGRNKNTGLRSEPGNYFFTCDVFERKGNVTEKRNITGVIEIVQ